jgi:N-formylglutamate deformylase
MDTDWLEVHVGDAPLLVSFPHTGTELTAEVDARMASSWLARKDADHQVHLLYDFVTALGATTVRTRIARTVIDVNRDPSGASLYPGQTTTELCPLTTFDGEALYQVGAEPNQREVAERRSRYFEPYHARLTQELTRLRQLHRRVVLYDAHAIRSQVPRLFSGTLPGLNIGSYQLQACDPRLVSAVEHSCRRSPFSWVTDGRFKGGWTTRHYGQPRAGIHALQMELAFRSFVAEPELPDERNWPPAYDQQRAAALRTTLADVLQDCLTFARTSTRTKP